MHTMIRIAREDVVAGNPEPVVRLLRDLVATPDARQRLRGKVVVLIDGWKQDRREDNDV